MQSKLTKKIIDATSSADKDTIIWDTELKGFGFKITSADKRSYFLYYRTRDGRQRRPKIGDHGVITCEQARETAKQWLGEVSKGNDPSSERSLLRSNPTIAELFNRYMQEYAPHKKSSSQERDKRLGEMYIVPKLGHLKISSISREDIIGLQKTMQKINANRMLRNC